MARPRPLSPHLSVYRPQLTSMMSIAHRGSGVLLSLGAVALVWWLHALAAGPDAYAAVQAWFGAVIGRSALFIWTVCLFYHLANGVRHLAWDAGYGFGLKQLYRSGWAVLALAGCATLFVWWLGYLLRGAA